MANTFSQALNQRQVRLGILLYLLLLPLLAIVPYWFPTDPTVASASSVKGYNNSIAHLMVLMWAAIGAGSFALLETVGYFGKQEDLVALSQKEPVEFSSPIKKRYYLEIAAVFFLFILLYFPTFLAKYGPYIEDSYFLTVLHRMHEGQRPYLNFESLYGPLMLYLPYFWTKMTGYSMSGYYAFIALMEAAQFAFLLAILQRYFPRFRTRIAVFILITIFLFNTLLGVSWNGLRRLLPVFILILVASQPRSKRVVGVASLLIGLLFTYSHEFGIICLLSVLSIYGLAIIKGQGFRNIIPAFAITVFSLSFWFISANLLLGDSFQAYFEAAIFAVNRYAGEGSFPFYWTVNSLATFGLLALALIIMGRGLSKKGFSTLGSGDYLLFGAVVYALLGLKSGLNRADMWHIATPMLALIFSFTLPLPKHLFTFSNRIHKLSIALLIMMATTYLAALFPTGSYYASGLLQGFRDTVLQNTPPTKNIVTRAPTIEIERSYPSQEILQLAEYLADPARSDQPVVLYSSLWSYDKRLGVTKPIYPTDDFLLSDEAGYEVRDYLQEHQDAIIIMARQEYDQLFSNSDSGQAFELNPLYEETLTKRILSWLSTVHYSAAEIEYIQKAKRWERTVGTYIQSNYKKVEEFGSLIVLMH